MLVADRMLLDWSFSRTEDLPYINWGLFGETAAQPLRGMLALRSTSVR